MNEHQEWLADFTEEQRRNYELCMKYPILIPTNRHTGNHWSDYEYDYTELDNLPLGWLVAFGKQWAAEIQEVINKLPEKERDTIRIMDIKEKYGQLCQYFSHYTEELRQVIDKYAHISAHTCIRCGAPATKISQGWIAPWCESCAEKIDWRESFVDINEYFSEVIKND